MRQLRIFFCICFVGSLASFESSFPNAQTTATQRFIPEQRILLLRGNMILNDKLTEYLDVLERAATAGFTEVIVSDSKTSTWMIRDYGTKWQANVTQLKEKTESLGMQFDLALLPYGYCGPMVAHDPNLAEGTPIKDAPLKAENGQLLPIATHTFQGGDFEAFEENKLTEWTFQDDPDVASFIDTSVKHSGSASLRFENLVTANAYGHGRIIQDLKVEPFKQYRLSAWFRLENFSANSLNAVIKTSTERNLLAQDFNLSNDDGTITNLDNLSNTTLEWTKVSWTFNSLDNTEVRLIMGAWGGKEGKFWIDNVSLEDVPTLNILRRDDLPLSITHNDLIFQEATDFERVEDPNLGVVPFGGKYSLTHEPITIKLPEGSLITEGETVLFSAYHPQLVQSGHVTCSLNNEDMFTIAENIFETNSATFNPDAYLLMHSEIRAGGWEPEQATLESTGQLIAENIKRTYDMTQKHASGKPIYVWSDMFDPVHNARAFYYQVKGDMAGSWLGLAKDLRVVTWWSGEKLAKHGAASMQFFDELGHSQIIGAYYDDDLLENYQSWQLAAQGVSNVSGVMFATWVDDYSEIETFAQLWWGDDQ